MKLYTIFSESHQILFDEFFSKTIPQEFELHTEAFEQVCESGEWYSKGWSAACKHKAEFFVKICEENLGESFIFSDVDIQFFGDCKDRLITELGNSDIACPHGDDGYCSGFFICRANERTLNMFRHMLNTFDKRHGDQYMLNKCIHMCKSKALSPLFYTIGQLSKKIWKPGDPVPIPDKILMHHANWTIGLDNKIALLKEVRQLVDSG